MVLYYRNMGNSPSKDDPLPRNSTNENSSSGVSSGGDLESDDSPALSRQRNKSSLPERGSQKSSSAIEIETKFSKSNNKFHRNNVQRSRSRSSNSSVHQGDGFDVEMGVELAQLLSLSASPNTEAHSHPFNDIYESTSESSKTDSFASSPVFTNMCEEKEDDLLLSLGSSPGKNFISKARFFFEQESLDPIHESLGEIPQSISGVESIEEPRPDIKHGSPNLSSLGRPGVKKDPFNLDPIIESLIQMGLSKYQGRRAKEPLPVSNQQIKYILQKSRSIFLEQPTLLRLSPPVKIVGDIHGQFSDLIRIFNSCGYPPHTNYLFLGDYVDRGCQSLETILLLLCFKIKYPENFFMLRGNHESANITKIYGFYDECKRRLSSFTGGHKVWKSFIDVFNTLPIAATINDKIFCIHGGLSPDLHDLNQIEELKRPTDIPDKGLLADLLWSDPDPLIKQFSMKNWPKNDRGVSYCFGRKHVDYWCSKFNIDLIVRGHMVVEDGYEFFNKRKLVTVFLAPNYCGEFNNYGAVMSVDKSLCCSFELLKPQ